MSDKTGIQWTDATWNPTTGCTKISPGCAHCYIERTPAFRIHGRKFVNGATDLRLHADRLGQPLHWRKPRRVFVNSLSDLFHPDVPDAFIARVFATMALTPRHTFQVLTKRPGRMRAVVSSLASQHTAPDGSGWPLPNVWLGVSVENQYFADERIPQLLYTPAAVRFISAEPLLGPVDLTGDPDPCRTWLRSGVSALRGLLTDTWRPPLDWVIVGGESGPSSRAFDIAWARSIVAQCQAAGVACFVKQLGANWFDAEQRRGVRGSCIVPIDSAFTWVKPTDKKGGDPNDWPSELRVREFPL